MTLIEMDRLLAEYQDAQQQEKIVYASSENSETVRMAASHRVNVLARKIVNTLASGAAHV